MDTYCSSNVGVWHRIPHWNGTGGKSVTISVMATEETTGDRGGGWLTAYADSQESMARSDTSIWDSARDIGILPRARS